MGALGLQHYGENCVSAKHPSKSTFVLQFSLRNAWLLCTDANDNAIAMSSLMYRCVPSPGLIFYNNYFANMHLCCSDQKNIYSPKGTECRLAAWLSMPLGGRVKHSQYENGNKEGMGKGERR